MLDMLHVADETYPDGRTPAYFHDEWDEESQRIVRLRVIAATPTGARRQEINGLFHRAQFNIRELVLDTDDNEEVAYFTWMDTAPQKPGQPIEPDADALEASGYHRLGTDTVLQRLVDKAESTEDYETLIDNMYARGIAGTAVLTKGLSSLIRSISYDLAATGIPPAYKHLKPRDIFTVIDKLRLLNANLSRVSQGHLLSNILRAVVFGSQEAQAIAADTLETALADNIIERRPNTMKRIFATLPIYRHPFATDMLHDYLADESRASAAKAFGIKPLTFAHDYIVTSLDSKLQLAGADAASEHLVSDFVRSRRTLGIPANNEDMVGLVSLAQRCLEAQGITAGLLTSDRNAVDVLNEHGTTAITESFKAILNYTETMLPQSQALDRAIRNRKSLEIVGIILAKSTAKKLGQAALDKHVDEPTS